MRRRYHCPTLTCKHRFTTVEQIVDDTGLGKALDQLLG